MAGRTIVVGDIHGDLGALDHLLARLPDLDARDTMVFLGDYVDRGNESRGVIERVQQLEADGPMKVVPLLGNHEAKWIECYDQPDPGFLLPRVNGCANTFRSFVEEAPLGEEDELAPLEIERLMQVASWMPRETIEWMRALPLWYEDQHAIYVHAGVDGRRSKWKHPRASSATSLLWMRRLEFYTSYQGKLLIFGHTSTDELPTENQATDRFGTLEVWRRGDLIGIDTACGKGGHLSAVELPSGRIYESRDLQDERDTDEVVLPEALLAAAR
jgi:serine/threonine protein phosphatase 1